jgi:hypothetical protein
LANNFHIVNDLAVETCPWIYIDTPHNKIYVIGFNKLAQEVENSLYHNFNCGFAQDFFSDYDAAQFFQIDTLKATVFANTFNRSFDNLKYFQGKHFGSPASNSLFSLSESLIFTFNPAESVSLVNTRELQFWQINSAHPGKISLPDKFVFDKANTNPEEASQYNQSVVLQVVANLSALALSNCLIMVHGHPTYGYVSNIPLNTVSNSYQTIVDYLPTINLSVDANEVYTDAKTSAVLTVNLGIILANTNITLDTNAGFVVNPKLYIANQSQTTKLYPIGMENGTTMKVFAGWSNYLHVANVSITAITPEVADGRYTTPGTYTFRIPTNYKVLQIELWGGGGGGGDSAATQNDGQDGGNSSFNNAIFARGGKKGTGGTDDGDGVNGLGGNASGGDVNIVGYTGTVLGVGGNAPASGGAGGPITREGSEPGGGGGGHFANLGTEFEPILVTGGSGGSGGYAKIRYLGGSGPSGNVTIVVGARGQGNGGGQPGGNGAIYITWS